MNNLNKTLCIFAMPQRSFHMSAVLQKIKVGKYKVTRDRSKPLTYEMANRPHRIAHRKAWNSWNTTGLLDSFGEPEMVIDDIFIRKFVTGTWHDLFVSEVIVKRQHNMVRIGGVVEAKINPMRMYFLIGYCEELLSYWLKGPVKLEIQVVKNRNSVIYKYI